MDFNFPREKEEPNQITQDVIGQSVLKLAEGMEGLFEVSPDFTALQADEDWDVNAILGVGAVCAFVKGIDPETDYDAALVMQGLLDLGYAPTGHHPKP